MALFDFLKKGLTSADRVELDQKYLAKVDLPKFDTARFVEVYGDTGIDKVTIGIYKSKPKTLPENQINFIL